MGISWDEFWRLNPRIIKLVRKGHRKKLEEQDFTLWLNGHYVMSAIATVADRLFSGENSKANYIEPLLGNIWKRDEKTVEEPAELTEEEKIRQTKALFTKLKIMGANFNITAERR